MKGYDSITLGQCECSTPWLNGDYVAAAGVIERAVHDHLAKLGLSHRATYCQFVNMATYHYFIFPTGTLPKLIEAMKRFGNSGECRQ